MKKVKKMMKKKKLKQRLQGLSFFIFDIYMVNFRLTYSHEPDHPGK